MEYVYFFQSGSEDPNQFLSVPALLPLAVLGKTDNEVALLQTVADQINQIESERERQDLSTVAQQLAGLQYSKELIQTIFRECG